MRKNDISKKCAVSDVTEKTNSVVRKRLTLYHSFQVFNAYLIDFNEFHTMIKILVKTAHILNIHRHDVFSSKQCTGNTDVPVQPMNVLLINPFSTDDGITCVKKACYH